jgi:hypothetical protein
MSQDNDDSRNFSAELETKKLVKLANILKNLHIEIRRRNMSDPEIINIAKNYETLFQNYPNLNCYIIAILIAYYQSFSLNWVEKDMEPAKLTNIINKLKQHFSNNNNINMNNVHMDICRYKIILDKYFQRKESKENNHSRAKLEKIMITRENYNNQKKL